MPKTESDNNTSAREPESTLFKANPNLEKFSAEAIEKRSKQLGYIFMVLVILAVSFIGGWLGASARVNQSENSTNVVTKQTVSSDQAKIIRGIAKNVGQSVVSINATSQSTSNFSYFYPPSSTSQEVAGTGIIISADGLILTNRHVVSTGTSNISVTLSDGTVYSNVQLVGRTADNDSLDIAFIKIPDLKGKTLSPATIGDSSQMQVGDPVVAIGNALGQFQNTITSGIISGFGRSVQAGGNGSASENLDDLFQTDAAINEGNSGGPLVNLSGQVIGINTAIASGSQNIGFAIPINDVTGLIKSVEQTGKLQRPYLGIVYIPLTNDIATQYNLSTNRGGYIPHSTDLGQPSIVPGGPADKAGVKEGDVITAINGKNIDQNTSVTSIVDQHQVGDTVTLTINRAGKTISVAVVLGAAPTG